MKTQSESRLCSLMHIILDAEFNFLIIILKLIEKLNTLLWIFIQRGNSVIKLCNGILRIISSNNLDYLILSIILELNNLHLLLLLLLLLINHSLHRKLLLLLLMLMHEKRSLIHSWLLSHHQVLHLILVYPLILILVIIVLVKVDSISRLLLLLNLVVLLLLNATLIHLVQWIKLLDHVVRIHLHIWHWHHSLRILVVLHVLVRTVLLIHHLVIVVELVITSIISVHLRLRWRSYS